MRKILSIFKAFLEIIVAPFNVIIKSNGIGLDNTRWTKAWVIFIVAAIVVTGLVLYYYSDYIFVK